MYIKEVTWQHQNNFNFNVAASTIMYKLKSEKRCVITWPAHYIDDDDVVTVIVIIITTVTPTTTTTTTIIIIIIITFTTISITILVLTFDVFTSYTNIHSPFKFHTHLTSIQLTN